MNSFNRIEKARNAANAFFKRLPSKAQCGLILFNHELKVTVPPGPDRVQLYGLVNTTPPSGGTAYLDATAAGIDLWLAESKSKGKAVVVMTDGVDLNSRFTLKQVIQKAQKAGVKVFAIGIGEPGKNDPVTTVLALDKSGSMLEPADDNDKALKIDALKVAAERFVDIMRSKARATLLEFNDQLRIPDPFTGNKGQLKQEVEMRISPKTARGETAFIDAAYTAVATLMAENPAGKKAVVVLTDGVDNSSRRRKEEVIALAKTAGIKIHMLGLGRPKELDQVTMEAIAQGTDGKYYHASNQKKLLELFENLSIQLHDDGIDEDSLKALAAQTGGQYYPVKDASQLQIILNKVSESVQKDYTIKFRSKFQNEDGTVRNITLELVRRTGSAAGGGPEYTVVASKEGVTQVSGVVVADMNYLVYLAMLGMLGVLLALPPAVRRLTKGAPGGN